MTYDDVFDRYEQGQISRRAAIAAIAALVASPSRSQPASPATFKASGLHHLALSVSDVGRSSEFYRQHLGLVETRRSSSSAFLDCGPHFLALFRSSTPGLAHYAYSIPDYDQKRAAERLRRVGLQPKLRGQRIYFDDPDGIEVQLSQQVNG